MIDKNNQHKYALVNENGIADNQKKQPLFTFTKFTINYLVPFMAPLFWEFTDIFQNLYQNDNRKKASNSLLMLLSSVIY